MAFIPILSGSDPDPGSEPRGPADPRKAVELLRRLPALPTVSGRLLGMMGKVDVNLKDISNLIGSDAALAAEILHMSNSAMFSMRSQVRSILQALAVLGTEKVKGLACTVALRNYLGNVLQIPALKKCWRHNLSTAVVCAEIADWARLDSGEAYTAAILHDIGRLALIALDPAKYLQLLDRAVASGGSLCLLENEIYGMDHCQAGEWLATSWGLPTSIQRAIRGHHEPLMGDPLELPGLVYYGCRIADFLGFSAMEGVQIGDDPLKQFLSALPVAQRDRLRIDVSEMQILIASRVNALEV